MVRRVADSRSRPVKWTRNSSGAIEFDLNPPCLHAIRARALFQCYKSLRATGDWGGRVWRMATAAMIRIDATDRAGKLRGR